MMNVHAYRSFVEDSVLELPLAALAPRLFESLDGYFDFMSDRHPASVPAIAELLHERMCAATPSGLPPRDQAVLESLVAGCSARESMLHLFEAHFDLLRGLLGVDQAVWSNGDPVELSQVRFIRVRYLPNFLKIQAMADVMGRHQAIDVMKQYLVWAIERSPSRPGGPQNLTELRTRQIDFNLQEAGMDWVSAIISEHQYLNKVTVCRIQKVLAEYGDSELMEVVACYPDFAMFRKTNENFRLTRTQTLMTGGNCCDTCYHDVRYVSDFVHPVADVFESLDDLAGNTS